MSMSRRRVLAIAATGFTMAHSAEEEPVLVWKRSGGIEGACEELKVWQNGRFRATSCKPNGSSKEGKLSRKRAEQLERWRRAVQSFRVEERDPAVADAMSVSLRFRGAGQREASDSERRAITDWAQQVYSR